MSKWKQNASEPCEVVRVDGEGGEDVGHVCDCALPETAALIVREHNSQAGLAKVCGNTYRLAFIMRCGATNEICWDRISEEASAALSAAGVSHDDLAHEKPKGERT